jgi:hypothetical protein
MPQVAQEATFEGRRENLNQPNKLSRSYAMLLDALNRHCGKGMQKIRASLCARIALLVPTSAGMGRLRLRHRACPRLPVGH